MILSFASWEQIVNGNILQWFVCWTYDNTHSVSTSVKTHVNQQSADNDFYSTLQNALQNM